MRFLSILLLSSFCCSAGVPLGTWKLHLPYRQLFQIEDAGDEIYCATAWSVYRYTKNEGYITTLDKVEGLSDVGVSAIAFDQESKILAIGYANSNIDLLLDGRRIENIPYLKLENIAASKKINRMRFLNGLLYVCTDLGILLIDPLRLEIRATYTIGNTGNQVAVYDLQQAAGSFYAHTAEGLKSAPVNSLNLQDFGVWSRIAWPSGLFADTIAAIGAVGNSLYAAKKDSIFRLNSGSWVLHNTSPGFTTMSGRVYGNEWYLSQKEISSSSFRIAAVVSGISARTLGRAQNLRDGYTDNRGICWGADEFQGLVVQKNGNEELVRPSGPYSAKNFNLAFYRDDLYVASGGVDVGWNYLWNSDGIFVRKNFGWEEYNLYNRPVLNNFSDLVSVSANTRSGKVYFGSYLSGLVEVDVAASEIRTWDKNNSLLGQANGDTIRTKISAVCTDGKGNTWVANTAAFNAMTVITRDGTFNPLYLPFFNNVLIKKMIADENGKLWCALRPSGLAVYDPGKDPGSTADDSYRIYGTGAGNGNLQNNNVLSLAEDKEGNVWAGTDQGIAIFYCSSSAAQTRGCDADQIKVERDGFVAYLFESEAVRAIAVDPANRKWIGTNNGVWLISADGKEEIKQFNIGNSPLPSNFIVDIVIHPTTGEVVIGTESGIVSYQGDAVKGGDSKGENVEVFPNPVESGYEGPVAIRGLVDNAYVKILDASGVLVYQGRANGGQFVWDVKGYKGERVQSGVYFVYASTDLGKERNVGKVTVLH